MADGATVDSTGLDCYLIESGVAITTKTECSDALAAGKRIGKIKSLGELGGTRAISENKYLSSDDTEKSVGSISYGNLSLEMPFDATDADGQAELRTMFSTKKRMNMVIVETDGNYTTVPVISSSAMKAYTIDEFVIFKVTVEQNGADVAIVA